MEKKIKKLQLNKETMAVLNNETLEQIIGGKVDMPCKHDVECPPNKQCHLTICIDILTLTSLAAPTPAGTICATIGMSYNHCPTAKTDCDSCMCVSRWCIS